MTDDTNIPQYKTEKPDMNQEPEQTPEPQTTQPADKGQTPSNSDGSAPEQLPTKEQFFEILMPVQDPEIRIGIVDLGLIYDIIVEDDNTVVVKMTLTTPSCPYGEMLISQVQDLVSRVPGVKEAKIDLVWEPVWDPREMASDYAKDQLGIW